MAVCAFLVATPLSIICSAEFDNSEVAAIVEQSKTNHVCNKLIRDVENRDQETIRFTNSLCKELRNRDVNYSSLEQFAIPEIDASVVRWEKIVDIRNSFGKDPQECYRNFRIPLNSQKMVTIAPDQDYGILNGAKRILENRALLESLVSENYTEGFDNYNYDYSDLTTLGGGQARGSSRMADMTATFFCSLYAVDKARAEQPEEHVTYANYALKLGIDITNSTGISRQFISDEFKSRLMGAGNEFFPELRTNCEVGIQRHVPAISGQNELIVFHSGYAFGGSRNHPDKESMYAPTDCSQWLIDQLAPYSINSDVVWTGLFKNSATRQRNKITELTEFEREFDHFFKVNDKNSHPKIGDILLKGGHVAVYLGSTKDGNPITISANRNRCLGPNSMEGIGLRLNDRNMISGDYESFTLPL